MAGRRHATQGPLRERNQPRLYRQLKALPWAKIPVQDETSTRGRGRYEIRRLQAVTCTAALALDFPYAVQLLVRCPDLGVGRGEFLDEFAGEIVVGLGDAADRWRRGA